MRDHKNAVRARGRTPARRERTALHALAPLGAAVTLTAGIAIAAWQAQTVVVAAAQAPVVVAAAPVVAPPPPPAVDDDGPLTLVLETTTDRLRAGETLSEALLRHRVAGDDVAAISASLKGALDLRALKAGQVLRLEKEPGSRRLVALEVRATGPRGVPRTITARRDGAQLKTDVRDAPIETRVEALGGEVRSNLYTAVVQEGGDALLVNRFVDVFAWDLDFYRATQRGDSWKVVVEKHYAGGKFIGFGDVLAAEYVNAGHVHRGFLYASKDGKVQGTFDDEGQALQRAFLKSPLEIARITSSYGQRFHPVLKREKKHEGVDYGAPSGTPFWAVADGIVKEAKWSPTAGKMLVIQHMNGYQTEYFHCSKFADGIKPGARVKQKQVIGYVGSTGRSTGPHLHFGMMKGGTRVDPQAQKFIKARGVPKSHVGDYQEFVRPLLEMLKGLDVA